jgi:pfkB family carbohydrate kinase
LRSNGARVVADLAVDNLAAALDSGLDILKISHEELIEGGYAQSDDAAEIVRGIHRLREAGASNVVVTRAAEPALAQFNGGLFEIITPPLEPSDFRGSGDSFTGGRRWSRQRDPARTGHRPAGGHRGIHPAHHRPPISGIIIRAEAIKSEKAVKQEAMTPLDGGDIAGSPVALRI